MLSITVCWSNSLSTRVASMFSQDSRSVTRSEDKETFLVTLTQPRLYVQQIAFDKGEQINSKPRIKSSNLQRCTISFCAKFIAASNFSEFNNLNSISVHYILHNYAKLLSLRVVCHFANSSELYPHCCERRFWKQLLLRLLCLVPKTVSIG